MLPRRFFDVSNHAAARRYRLIRQTLLTAILKAAAFAYAAAADIFTRKVMFFALRYCCCRRRPSTDSYAVDAIDGLARCCLFCLLRRC